MLILPCRLPPHHHPPCVLLLLSPPRRYLGGGAFGRVWKAERDKIAPKHRVRDQHDRKNELFNNAFIAVKVSLNYCMYEYR